ncbi:MAG: hypothetical protein H0W35_05015 [Actinobacteria bacterium]|nr:hypothetical protein [Actinomycetota bacterium]
MAPQPKLSDADVKQMRRRVRAGAHQTDLAREYGVNRKTIRRRLAELERVEAEHAERLAAKRRRWQAPRERQKLRDRERERSPEMEQEADPPRRARRSSSRHERVSDPFLVWLDQRKNLSGRALSQASGLIRIESADGSRRVWVERAEVEGMLDAGWLLSD